MTTRRRRGNGEGSIDQRADGVWRARISLADGTRKVVYGRTRADVARRLAALQEQQARHQLVTSGKATCAQWFAQWLADHVDGHVAQTTLERYRGICNRYLEPRLGRVPLEQLSPSHIQRLHRELRADGLAPATIALVHTVVHRSLRAARRMRLVATNVAADVPPPPSGSHDATERAFTTDQLVVLRGAIRGHRHEHLWIVLAETGLRVGEALALQWADVNLEAHRLMVRRSYRRTLSGPVLSAPKTKAGRRTIPLSQAACEALTQQRERVRQMRKDAELWSTEGLVFPNGLGKPLRADKLLEEFKQVLAAAGLPPKRLHDLRHGLATRLFAADVHPVAVQRILGHAKIETTIGVYTGAVPAMLSDAIARLDATAS
jgi:integrase